MFGFRKFPGGVHPHESVNGKRVNGKNAIKTLAAPARVIIPLSQHIGAPAKALVKKGDRVKIGQLIGQAGGFVSANVHASVSGIVWDVQPTLLANGSAVPAVIIDNDYKDEWVELQPAASPEALSADELRKIVTDAGIVGLGGATFPTAVKFSPAAGKTIEMLVINGAECEPYLTADHRLMVESAETVIGGITIVMKALNVSKAVIGIENNKRDAIEALKAAARDGITVVGLPVRYPQGGEKQLVYALTKKKVPAGGLPLDVGVVVCNVGTMHAVHQAATCGLPLIQRVVTVGGLVENPGNFLVRVGTTVEQLLDACGGMKPGVKQLIYGGPMMGTAIARTDIPVTKGCSGILALGEEAKEPEESACIRCGRCVRACPMKLLPAKLDALSRAQRFEEAEQLGVMNCMECGACTFACPAKRSLTQACRTAKKVITTRRKQATMKKGD